MQKLNFEKVLARLEQEKSAWFLKHCPEATQTMVAEMILPRALTLCHSWVTFYIFKGT